jgi:ABC-2 type transport system ATP-binding protein
VTHDAITVKGLRVVRGENLVLEALSLRVGAGRVTGLLGPSGSGKTTLLRAIVGVQRIEGGTVSVLGEPGGAPRLRHRVAYSTQTPAVYPDLTVRENVRFFARVLGLPPSRVDEAIDAVKLTRLGGRLVRDLSGGERARVALATALVGQPELLVLDEPTVGLDPVLRRELWQLFHSLAQAGATLLVSSHVMDEADRCDELLLLREGALLAAGTPAELRGRVGVESLEDVFLRLIDEAVP